MANPSDTFVSPARAAELLGVSRRSVYRWVGQGTLPALRVGSAANSPLRIRTGDLVEQLRLIDTKEHPK